MTQFKVSVELFADDDLGGYSACCPEFDVYSQGETEEEAIANIKEAVTGYIITIGPEQARKEYRQPLYQEMEITI